MHSPGGRNIEIEVNTGHMLLLFCSFNEIPHAIFFESASSQSGKSNNFIPKPCELGKTINEFLKNKIIKVV